LVSQNETQYTNFIILKLKMNFPNYRVIIIPIWKFLEHQNYYLKKPNLYTTTPIEGVRTLPVRDRKSNYSTLTLV
ncbi:MAG: hypothetical protein ACRCUP_03875, partial [Mycoplasmatales bacterium]